MNHEEIEAILAIRLLIARAANKDSLAWWDDEALSGHAEYILQRMFPVAPTLAGRQLALEAAFARHQALVPPDAPFVHLYRLTTDNRDRLAARFHDLQGIDVPEKPITTVDELRARLLKLTRQPMPYSVERRASGTTFRIVLPPCPDEVHPDVHRAQTLAWAYLESQPEQMVIPYCADNTSQKQGNQ